MNDKEREEFEAWATAKGYISVIGGVKAFAPICHNTYEAWQASAERYATRFVELETLNSELLGLLKAIDAHSTQIRLNGILCAAFPLVEYEVIVSKLKGGA